MSLPSSQAHPQGMRLRGDRLWRQSMLQRVGLGLAGATCALIVSCELTHTCENTLLGAMTVILALCATFFGFTQQLSYTVRAWAIGLLATGIAVLMQLHFPSTAIAGYLLGLTAVVLSSLLLHRTAGVVSALVFLCGDSLVYLIHAESDPARLTVLASSVWFTKVLGFGIMASISLWWADFGVDKIRQSLVQRDELVRLVRQETEERIAQLEKQQSLERQLRQSQKMEALGTLAGGIAHDFNNLLLVIASGAQSAKDAEPRELQEILEEIRDAAGRGGSLTKQLLAFGRRKINDRGAVDLNREVENSLQLIRRLIPSNVQLHFEPGEHVQAIEAAAVDVDQVIMNLCINARDAMPNGGELWVSTYLYQAPGHVAYEAVISVRDSGVGMTPEARERAFEPFFTTKRTGAGTGLGLSVVHTIVKNHKGRMEIESSEGRGSEFRVYFPHFDHGFSLAPPSQQASVARGGERILLVDDDPAVRKGIARVLRRAGYEVLIAVDGEEALRLYENGKDLIDLVVTDAVMPNMGGRDLCEAVSRINPEQPCLICTGYDAGTIEEGFFVEARRDFLAKPFDNDQLLARVRALLDLRRAPSQAPSSPARLRRVR